jgi:hypothetical protein
VSGADAGHLHRPFAGTLVEGFAETRVAGKVSFSRSFRSGLPLLGSSHRDEQATDAGDAEGLSYARHWGNSVQQIGSRRQLMSCDV